MWLWVRHRSVHDALARPHSHAKDHSGHRRCGLHRLQFRPPADAGRVGDQFVNLDKLTYAGNLHNLRASIDNHRRLRICAWRHRRSRSGAATAGKTQPARNRSLRRGKPCGPFDPRAGRFHSHQCRRNIRVTGRGASLLERAAEARTKNFRFLHVSTDEVYGSLGPDDPPFTETTPYAPNSPYAASKAASDHLVRAYHHTYGLPTLTTNCSNNYGPFQFPEKLIPLMILNARDGKPLPVYGDGKNVRDWLYVEDHCDAIATVLKRGRRARPTTSADGTRSRTSRSCKRFAICSMRWRPSRVGSRREIDHLRERPARTRSPLCDGCAQDRTRTGLEAEGNIRKRHPQDGALVS